MIFLSHDTFLALPPRTCRYYTAPDSWFLTKGVVAYRIRRDDGVILKLRGATVYVSFFLIYYFYYFYWNLCNSELKPEYE